MYRSSVSLHGRCRSPDGSTSQHWAVDSSSPPHAVSSAQNASSSIRPRPNHSATLRAELARAKIAANSGRMRGSSSKCLTGRDRAPSSSLDREKRRIKGRAASSTMGQPTTMTGVPNYDWNGRPPRGSRRRSTSGGDPNYTKASPSTDDWQSDAFWDELPSMSGCGATDSAKQPNGVSSQSCYGALPRSESVARVVTYASRSDSDEYDQSDTGGDDQGVWARRRDDRSASNEKLRRQSLPPRGRSTSGGHRSRSTSGGPVRDVETRPSACRMKVAVTSRSCPASAGIRSAVVVGQLPESVEHLIDEIRRLQDCLAEKTAQLSVLLKCSGESTVVGKINSLISPAVTSGAQVNNIDDHRVEKNSSSVDDEDDQLALAIAESYKTALGRDANDCASQPPRNQCLGKEDASKMASGGVSSQSVTPEVNDARAKEQMPSAKQSMSGRPGAISEQIGHHRHAPPSVSSSSSSSLPTTYQRRRSEAGAYEAASPLPAIQRQQSQQQRAGDEALLSLVCEHYEPHLCPSSRSRLPATMVTCCQRHGGRVPYYWRVRRASDGTWCPLANGVEVERAFSNPGEETFKMAVTQDGEKIELNLVSMTSSVGELERLSTPSYVINRNTIDATRWRWYRNDGSDQQPDWKPYEDLEAPYQDVLESKYLKDHQQTVCFQVCQLDYAIDFSTMEQTNVATKMKRIVRRRPTFYCIEETTPTMEQVRPIVYMFNSLKLPAGEGWSPMNTEQPGHADIVPVNCVSKFNEVVEEFHQTMRRTEFGIRSVYRVQNLTAWNEYNRRKSNLLNDLAARSTLPSPLPLGAVPDKVEVSERRLFHGLPGGWPLVVRTAHQNIDPRSDERRPTPFGLGAGFSVSAGKGSHFGHSMTQRDTASGLRYVLLARVLIGRPTRGLPFMKGPSRQDDPSDSSYDCTVDDMANPTEYVLFDRRHIYPEYVIAYDDLRTTSRSNCVIL